MIKYNLVLYILSPFIISKILFSTFIRKAGINYFFHRIGLTIFKTKKTSIWLHASSIGETKIALKVYESLMKENQDYEFLITTTTPSASKVVDESLERLNHCYLPFDFFFTMKRFIKSINPKICIIMETEIWPNLLRRCKENDIPTLILNARLSKKTLSSNDFIKNIYKKSLDDLTHIYCKSEREKDNFISLGARENKTTVIGNLKLSEPIKQHTEENIINRKYVLAASTHSDEERQIISEWLKVNDKRILLVVVPRHPERLGDILSNLPLSMINIAIRSKGDKIRNSTQVYIADTHGELNHLMAHCEFVIMGGSLVDHGGQNFLEAASYGKSIIVGPFMYNFIDETEEFLKNNSMIMVKNSKSLKHVFERLLKSKQRRELFGNNAKKLLQSKINIVCKYRDVVKNYL
tara:strand:- start:9 stop:1232 length:1224 start_codon:yes stop_codon:yes gene_type:complete